MSVQGKDLLEVDKRWRCHHDRRQCCKRFDDTGRSSIGRQDRSALLIAKETVLVDSFVKRVRDWMVSTISPSSTSSSASEADAGTATVSLMLFELNPRALPTSAAEARVRTRSVHPRPQSSVPAPPVLTIAVLFPRVALLSVARACRVTVSRGPLFQNRKCAYLFLFAFTRTTAAAAVTTTTTTTNREAPREDPRPGTCQSHRVLRSNHGRVSNG